MICPQCQAPLLTSNECANCPWKIDNNGARDEINESTPIPIISDTKDTIDSNDGQTPVSTEESSNSAPSIENSQVEGKVEDVSNSPISIGKENITGHGISVIKNIGNVYLESEKKFKEEKTPPSWTIQALSPLEGTRLQFNPEDLEKYGTEFKSRHLLIISCFDEEIAKYAADSITNQIDEIKPENSRTVFFEGNIDGSNESIHELLKQDEIKNNFILIDCINNDTRTRSFIDSLFSHNLNGRQNITTRLKDSRSFWIYLVDPTSIDSWLKDARIPTHFPVWDIDFLTFLLQKNYSNNYLELRERISNQRKLGKWAEDQSKFFVEIRNLLDGSHRLIQELEQKDLVTEFENVDVGSQYDWSNQVISILLFVATYFQNLTRGDMDRVMLKICGSQTISVPQNNQPQPDENSTPIMQEKRLAEIWTEASDKFIRECNLKMSTTVGKARVFTFTNSSIREKLKSHFEEELSFDLARKVESVWREGLLFERSETIAENVINLTIDTITDYADDYNSEWFMKHFLNNLNSKEDKRLVYARFSELLRRLLEFSQLRDMVSQILESLMRNRYHIITWEIARQLQFAPNFNFFHWTKQLIERGGEVGEVVYIHLYLLFKKQDENIYELLENLKPWLPDNDRLPATYSPANHVALSIMIHYCLQSIEEFDEEDYGLQPSRYPLFAFQNRATAEKNLSLLTEWVFHPGMRAVLNEEIPLLDLEEFWGILIVGWLFILLENNNKQQTEQILDIPLSPNDSIEASELLVILLEQVSSLTQPEQQKEMKAQWERLKNSITNTLDSIVELNARQRNSLKLQRNLLKKLIEEFKIACKRTKRVQENV